MRSILNALGGSGRSPAESVKQLDQSQLGCSITGGYVYRGGRIDALEGDYVFADFCAGTIWALRRTDSGADVRVLAEGTDLRISSFGQGEAGQLDVVDLRGWLFEVVVR